MTIVTLVRINFQRLTQMRCFHSTYFILCTVSKQKYLIFFWKDDYRIHLIDTSNREKLTCFVNHRRRAFGHSCDKTCTFEKCKEKRFLIAIAMFRREMKLSKIFQKFLKLGTCFCSRNTVTSLAGWYNDRAALLLLETLTLEFP